LTVIGRGAHTVGQYDEPDAGGAWRTRSSPGRASDTSPRWWRWSGVHRGGAPHRRPPPWP